MVGAGSKTIDEAIRGLGKLLEVAQIAAQETKKLRPGEIGDGLTVLQHFIEIQELIESANSDAQSTVAISNDDAQKIVQIVQDIVATVVDFLHDLISRASDFYFIERGFILRCLDSIWKSIRRLAETLHQKCPPEYQGTAEGLIDETNVAFKSCIQAYSP